ncbi:hypothetical protein B0T21DRAFT_96610 [Apiosordaria backusii]|uniref:Uncharacterized protein n=1 Tax=Apiosordaria backusii TaxID=314023 RepID=A0AA40ETE0_9PEZI|nr:hypothetical protein B0T21DRAFT_96610 [Apiosordaria backusii]
MLTLPHIFVWAAIMPSLSKRHVRNSVLRVCSQSSEPLVGPARVFPLAPASPVQVTSVPCPGRACWEECTNNSLPAKRLQWATQPNLHVSQSEGLSTPASDTAPKRLSCVVVLHWTSWTATRQLFGQPIGSLPKLREPLRSDVARAGIIAAQCMCRIQFTIASVEVRKGEKLERPTSGLHPRDPWA